MEDNKRKDNKSIVSGLIWKFFEKGSSSGISFIIQIILARLLVPSDYGTIALVMVFVSIANIFVESGLGASLIQKKEIKEIDVSSVFLVSFIIALVLYSILFLLAPTIALFFNNNNLIRVIRVLSTILIIGAINSIQIAVLTRKMQFKVQFYCNLFSSLISGLVGIFLAFWGYGVWSLVFQLIIRQILLTILLFVLMENIQFWHFSLKRVASLYSYGWKMMLASLISTIYQNLRNLVIGRKFSSSDLGFYNRGSAFPSLIINNVSGSIQTVLFSAFAEHQDNRVKLKQMTRTAVAFSSFFSFPLMLGLAGIAPSLILILLTEKWLPIVPYIQILALSYATYPISDSMLQSIKAIGRSDLHLSLEIARRVVGVTILIFSIRFGIIGICIGETISEVIAFIFIMIPLKKELGYTLKEQLLDILPSLFISSIMLLMILFFNNFIDQLLIKLIIQIISGVVFYFVLAKIFKIESFIFILKKLLDFLKLE